MKLSVLVEGMNPPKAVVVKVLAKKWPKEPPTWHEQAVKLLLKCDPVAIKSSFSRTPYLKNALEWFITGQITLPEDVDTVAETLLQFNRLRNSNPKVVAWVKSVGGDAKNMLPLGIELTKLREIIEPYLEKEYDAFDYLQKLGQDGDFAMYLVNEWLPGGAGTTKTGAVVGEVHKAFTGTSWCVKYKGNFNSYKPPYFLFTNRGSRYALMHLGSKQLKDPNDKALSISAAAPLRKLASQVIPPQLVDELTAALKVNKDPHALWFGDIAAHHCDMSVFYSGMAKPLSQDDTELVMTYGSPSSLYKLAAAIGRRLPEQVEARFFGLNRPGPPPGSRTTYSEIHYRYRPSFKTAVEYAENIIKGRWPLFEHVTLTMLRRPLGSKVEEPDGEDAASGSDLTDEYGFASYNTMIDAAIYYAKNVIKGQWPELHEAIRSPRLKLQYAIELKIKDDSTRKHLLDAGKAPEIANFITGTERWPEGEDALRDKDEKLFASYVRGLKLGDNITARDAVDQAIYNKADEVPEWEPVILTDLRQALRYARQIKGPWPELEDKLVEYGGGQQGGANTAKALALDYYKYVLHFDDWPEAERVGLVQPPAHHRPFQSRDVE